MSNFDDYMDHLKSSADEAEGMHDEIERLERMNDKLIDENRALEAQLRDEKAWFRDAQAAVVSGAAEIGSLKASNALLRERRSEDREKIERLEKQRSDAERDCANLVRDYGERGEIIATLRSENARLTKSLEESHKIIRAYEDARHEWGNKQNVEAIAQMLWHRFAPAHHIGWEDELKKAEYRLAAADALAVVTGQIELPRVRDEHPVGEDREAG